MASKSSTSTRICRLCLDEISKNKCKPICKVTGDVLDTLLLSLNLETTKSPVICEYCEINLRRVFNFKAACMDTEDILFIVEKGQRDLNDIYFKLNSINGERRPQTTICRLCFKPSDNQNVKALHILRENMPEVVDIFGKHFPEIMLDSFNNPHICSMCISLLHETSKFLSMLEKTEGLIRNYIEKKNVGSKEELDLYKVRQDICIEEYTHMKIDMIDQNFRTGQVQIPSGSKRRTMKKKSNKPQKIFQCKNCPYKSNNRGHLERHRIVHKSFSDVEVEHCDKCDFKTKNKGYLKIHLLQHIDVRGRETFQCKTCPFKTMVRYTLKKHMLLHTDTPTAVFKCNDCDFQTIYKSSYNYHILSHKRREEVDLFKCDSCDYQSRHRSRLVQHLLVHRKPRDDHRLECDKCEYKAKTKSYLKKHLKTHKPSSEVKMYQCSICSYESRHNWYVKKHEMIHK